MAVKAKIVTQNPVKDFIDGVAQLKNEVDALREKSLTDKSITDSVVSVMDKKYDDILKKLGEHYNETFTAKEPSKLTEFQTYTDLNELWDTVKLLKGVRRGTQSREELLGITNA